MRLIGTPWRLVPQCWYGVSFMNKTAYAPSFYDDDLVGDEMFYFRLSLGCLVVHYSVFHWDYNHQPDDIWVIGGWLVKLWWYTFSSWSSLIVIVIIWVVVGTDGNPMDDSPRIQEWLKIAGLTSCWLSNSSIAGPFYQLLSLTNRLVIFNNFPNIGMGWLAHVY